MFNCIDDVDIGGYYTYLSSVMADSLEKIMQLCSNNDVDIPRGILEEVIDLFDTVVKYINIGEEEPMNLRHYTIYSLVKDAYIVSIDREENRDKLHSDIKEMGMFVRTLEHPVIVTNSTKDVYSRLQGFFKRLSEISSCNDYERRLYGVKSKYTFPQGF